MQNWVEVEAHSQSKFPKSRKHLHIFVDGSVGAMVTPFEHEQDESRIARMSGGRSGISFGNLKKQTGIVTFHVTRPMPE